MPEWLRTTCIMLQYRLPICGSYLSLQYHGRWLWDICYHISFKIKIWVIFCLDVIDWRQTLQQQLCCRDMCKLLMTLQLRTFVPKTGGWCYIKMRYYSIVNPIVELRRSNDRLISTMGFTVLAKWHLYIESRHRYLGQGQVITSHCFWQLWNVSYSVNY